MAFVHDVSEIDWNDVLLAGTVDDAVATFNFSFLQLVNYHIPWRRIRCRVTKSPWISLEFLSFIDRREHFARKYRENPTPELLFMKQEAIRACNKLKRELKRAYVERSLDKFSNNSKKLWKCIRNFLPNEKKQQCNFNMFGSHLSDTDKANKLNEHFTTIASKLASSLPEVNLELSCIYR